ERVNKMLARLEDPFELSREKPFLLPPAGADGEPQRNCGVDAFEFPEWFVCQNSQCGALVVKHFLTEKNNRWYHECDAGKPSPAVPVRFVMACKNGHLDEVHWRKIAHGKAEGCANPRLRLIEGKTGD